MPVGYLNGFIGFSKLQLRLFSVDKHKNLDFFRQGILEFRPQGGRTRKRQFSINAFGIGLKSPDLKTNNNPVWIQTIN
jgi:hypothetical protein